MNEFPRVNFAPRDDTRWYQFLVRWAVRNWVRWKEVYNGIGLSQAAMTIVRLKQMAGILPASVEGPGGGYSVKELAQALHDVASYQWGWWRILDDQHGNLIGQISVRELLQLLQTYRSDPYTSLREALSQ